MDVSQGTPPPDVARLFLALWPPPAVREAIAGWRGAWWWPPAARLVQDERLHLTLHFIGAVPASRLPAPASPRAAAPAKRAGLELGDHLLGGDAFADDPAQRLVAVA